MLKLVLITGVTVLVCLAGPAWSADEAVDQIDCCIGMRGDMNYDGGEAPDPIDLVYLVDFLFNGGLPPLCRTEADFNGDGSIDPDPLDLAALVNYLFSGGVGPAGCVTLGVQSAVALQGAPGEPFVSIALPGKEPRGVGFDWTAEYSLDPGQPAEFKCHWRVYGPYSSSEMSFLETNIFTWAYETYDGQVFDLGDTIWVCRDSITSEYDPILEPCQELVISIDTDTSLFGRLVPVFDVTDPNFQDLFFDRVAAESGTPQNRWVYASGDTALDLFRFDPGDTTREMYFVLWLQAADDYGNVESTASFASFRAIDAKFEYDFLVMDYTSTAGLYGIVAPPLDTVRNYWVNVMQQLRPFTDFQPDRDFVRRGGKLPPVALTTLLSRRVCVVTADGPANASEIYKDNNVRKAMAHGVSVWVLELTSSRPTLSAPFYKYGLPVDWATLLGVQTVTFNGWMCSAVAPVFSGIDEADCPGGRIEDFVGASSTLLGWPDLTIDTVLLHSRYNWGSTNAVLDSAFAWEPYLSEPPIGALPGVSALDPTGNAQVLYTYSSLYGDTHPNGFGYSFNGDPVAVRVIADDLRTAYFSFTPLAFDQPSFDTVIDSMLTWLYEPWE